MKMFFQLFLYLQFLLFPPKTLLNWNAAVLLLDESLTFFTRSKTSNIAFINGIFKTEIFKHLYLRSSQKFLQQIELQKQKRSRFRLPRGIKCNIFYTCDQWKTDSNLLARNTGVILQPLCNRSSALPLR